MLVALTTPSTTLKLESATSVGVTPPELRDVPLQGSVSVRRTLPASLVMSVRLGVFKFLVGF